MIEKSDLFLAYTPAPGIISLNPDGSIDPEFVAPVLAKYTTTSRHI
jgi:hypothetical protein